MVKALPPSIESTVALIQKHYANVRDHQGVPYTQHCTNVLHRLPEDAPIYAKFAALLHDLLEDTDVTADDLKGLGYPDETLAIIELVGPKKSPHEKALSGDAKNIFYFHKIRTIGQSDNIWAMRIKFADLQENNLPSRFETLADVKQAQLSGKYMGMQEYLGARIARYERTHSQCL